MKTPRWKKGIWSPSHHSVKILPPPPPVLLGFFCAKKERANVRNRGFHFDKTFKKGLAKFCNTLPKRSQKVKYFLAFPCARCFFQNFLPLTVDFFVEKALLTAQNQTAKIACATLFKNAS